MNRYLGSSHHLRRHLGVAKTSIKVLRGFWKTRDWKFARLAGIDSGTNTLHARNMNNPVNSFFATPANSSQLPDQSNRNFNIL